MSWITYTSTTFYQVEVTIIDDNGKYSLTCVPNEITVDAQNSVITYCLAAAPDGTAFWGLDISPPGQMEFKPPQISAQGRLMTLDDIDSNKAEATYNVTLKLSVPGAGVISFDPQIINRPG